MSRRYPGGLITKTPVVPTVNAAPGIWTLDQAIAYIKAETWPKTIGGPYWIGLLRGSFNDYARSIAVDYSGNVYVCGDTEQSSGSTIYNFQIAKYNNSGVIQWQRRLGNTGVSEGGKSVAVDSSGNIYVCGYSFISGFGAIQIAKYDTSGTILWQQALVDTVGTGANSSSVAVDSSGNVYVCGISSISTAPYFYLQIAKYNTSGTIQWQKRSTSGSSGSSVAVDSSGNIYVSGISYASVGDIVVIKLDYNGNIQWQRRLLDGAGVANSGGNSVAVDSSGNIYVCGNSTINGTDDFLIAKYNGSGTVQWQRILGGSNADIGYSVAVDLSGNVYVCGYSNIGTYVFQIAKYNTSGTIQWQRRLAGGSSGSFGQGVAVDVSGNVYVCGYPLISSNYDFLIAKLPSDGSLTGTYTVGGVSVTYAASTLTDAASTLVDSTSSLSITTSTLTDSASTLTDAASTLTSSVTTL